MQIYTLNAFAKTALGGNPAGVVLSADNLSRADKQKIAAKIGFSETAFVQKSNRADFRVEFFTPNEEVDLCGHATIATFSLLANKGIIKTGKYTQETKAGILKIECTDSRKIYMQQRTPEFYQILDKNEIAASLGVSTSEISENLPIQIVSTGLKDIIVPISSLKMLLNIKPDFEQISNLSSKYGAVGYHIFTLETMLDSTANCRNFAPLYCINEEAATGTSTGALSCYLYKHNVISEKNAKHMIFEQGYSMDMPSELFSSLTVENKEISEVTVGGIALNIEQKNINEI